MEESYAEAALEIVTNEVQRYVEAQTPVIVQVEHNYRVEVLVSGRASVRDEYLNRNYRIDRNGEPIDDPDKAGTYVETYDLKELDGTWKVVDIVRESP